MRRIILNSLLTALFIAAIIGTVQFLADGRMAQLDRVLASASHSAGGDAAFNISARLNLMKKRMRLGEAMSENYETEARIQSIVSGMRLYRNADSDIAGGKGRFRLFKATGRLMGRPAPMADGEDSRERLVEEAFFWERNRVYDRAIELYGEAMDANDSKGTMTDVIRLHVAFCELMTADFDSAEEHCLVLKGKSLDPIILDSARLMIDFIDEVRSMDLASTQAGRQGLERGRDLYFSVDYSGAVETLADYLESEQGYIGQSEARYYKARAHEEMGQIAEAVEEYRRVILLGEDDRWYREAGNRLLMLEAFYGVDYSAEDGLAAMGKESADAEVVEIVDAMKPLAEREAAGIASDPHPRGLMAKNAEEESEAGEILVKTAPPGVRIVVDGKEIGRGPVFVPNLPLGKTLVSAEYKGEVRTREITVEASDIAAVSFDFRPTTGTLVIGSYWLDTKYSLDGKPIRPDDGVLRDLKPGRYLLEVTGKSIAGSPVSWKGSVTVIAGEVVSLAVP